MKREFQSVLNGKESNKHTEARTAEYWTFFDTDWGVSVGMSIKKLQSTVSWHWMFGKSHNIIHIMG